MEKSKYRQLEGREISLLKELENHASDWNSIYISDETDISLIVGNRFKGKVYIGALKSSERDVEGRIFDLGIRRSSITDCYIGDYPVIEDVAYISDAKIGNKAVLFHVGEILSTNDPPFLMDICNENGGRSIVPYPGMGAGDAFALSRNRDDDFFQQSMVKKAEYIWKEIPFNLIGDNVVIIDSGRLIHSRLLKGSFIRGLKEGRNIILNSREGFGCRIENALELKNGIMEPGSYIGSGVIAGNFYLGEGSILGRGARFFHSFLGASSTVNCCEVQNCLLAPFHEQHHNNSFLIATAVMGQSNIAAGATIGSNHNSRRNDGELLAERGFWPGLNVSLKYDSLFAPFTLIVKGHYNYEIQNPYPFSLIWNNEDTGDLSIYPAFHFLHNMYALERGKYKFRERDQRLKKDNLPFEYDYLAPDTVDAVVNALKRLKEQKEDLFYDNGLENSRRRVSVMYREKAVKAYEDMLLYYAVRTIIEYSSILNGEYTDYSGGAWKNYGGFCINEKILKKWKSQITSEYGLSMAVFYHQKENQNSYILEKYQHAHALFKELTGLLYYNLEAENRKKFLLGFHEILQLMEERVYSSRVKDYDDLFRKDFYSGEKERDAVLGRLKDDPVFHQVENHLNELRDKIEI